MKATYHTFVFKKVLPKHLGCGISGEMVGYVVSKAIIRLALSQTARIRVCVSGNVPVPNLTELALHQLHLIVKVDYLKVLGLSIWFMNRRGPNHNWGSCNLNRNQACYLFPDRISNR